MPYISKILTCTSSIPGPPERLRARIIERARLPGNDARGADDEDGGDVSTFGHLTALLSLHTLIALQSIEMGYGRFDRSKHR